MVNNVLTDVQKASKLLDIYRGEVDDFFKLWPPDKKYFFSEDGKAFLAYGIKRKAAVCMGDAIGPERSIMQLLPEFKSYCHDHALTMAFIQTTNKYSSAYKSIGLRNILIGADAVIDLGHFTGSTVHNKYFRNIVNRFEKQSCTVSKYVPPHDNRLISELKQVSDSWAKLPHRKEWSFLTGRFDAEYLQLVTLHVLRDKNGKAQAFANELPSFKPGVATIDLMRHRKDAPTNSIDYLFIRLLQVKNQEGYTSFNLGISPLDGKPFTANLSARLLIYTYRISNRFIGFKGLHQFKSKYEPIWEPRYVWYQGSPLRLLQLGVAVSKLLKGSS